MKQLKTMNSKLLSIGKSVVAVTAMMLAAQTLMAQPAVVVVNQQNKVDVSKSEAKEIVARIYKKNQSNWPDGEEARPISREGDLQAILRDKVLDMSRSQWEQHWVTKKQRSGETPPRAVSSTRMVVRLVERDPGGITILNEQEMDRYGSNVRVLFWFEE